MRYRFESFELDTDAFELRHDGERVSVEPQVFGVLACLLERHERLVSRDELLDVVWGHRFVSDATVASRVKAARQAIGDDGTAQRLIRTVTGRGYRFVGSLEAPGGAAAGRGPVLSEVSGRGPELATLAGLFEQALQGSTCVAIVEGPAGVGKTALAHSFIAKLDPAVRVWRGQCLRSESGSEPYRPILAALAMAAALDDDVVEELVRRAPGWLAQLPVDLDDDAARSVAARALGVTRGRLVRELLAVVDTLTAERPLVLLIEDLHWADDSSLEVIEALARGAPGRALALVTVRQGERAEARDAAGRALAELAAGRVAHVIPLAGLSNAAIGELVGGRLGVDDVPAWLPELLGERTRGNALFVRCLVDDWLDTGRIEVVERRLVVDDRPSLARDLPDSVRRLIGAQLDALPADDRLLVDAASVAGEEFSALEVAAGLGLDLVDVDDRLSELAALGSALRAGGVSTWPSGARCGAYAFVHQLHRDAAYERLSASRRATLHARIGPALEQAYGDRAAFFAARLAHHFVAAGDTQRAVHHLTVAASQSLALSAHADAAGQAALALQLHERGGPRDVASEIALRSILATAEIALRGWAAPEIEAEYRRAQALSEASGDVALLAPVVYGLATLHEYRGEYERSEALMAEYLDGGAEALVPEALELLACSTFHQGQFARSLAIAERALAEVDPSLTSEYLARYGESPIVNYRCWAALDLLHLGRDADALEQVRAALAAAETHTYSRTTALAQAAFLHQLRGDSAEARRAAEETISVATEHGFPFRVAQATIARGWALASAGEVEAGCEEVALGLGLYRATGAGMDMPYYLGLAAEVAALAGRHEEAWARLREARGLLPERGYFYEAPLLRLEALFVAPSDPGRAAELLEAAVAVARVQGATGLVPGLERLWASAAAGEAIDLAGPAG